MTNSSLIAIVGPTGSGKSALALALAPALAGEIVNFDSVQLYLGMNVGSAKIPVAERLGIPHHFLDVVSPEEDFTAGEFSRRARELLAQITARGTTPILVGGTGFYLRSLLDGLSPASTRNADLRQRLTEVSIRRPFALHRLLRRLDRLAAERIHANDHQKLIRALELAGESTSPLPRQALQGYDVLKIALNPPRAELHHRINQRTAKMFDLGLIEEVRGLLAAGVSPSARGLQSLGYKQALAVIEGSLSLPDAVQQVQTRTRQYAKRQMTWFRHERDVHWLEGFGDDPKIQTAAQLILLAAVKPAASALPAE